MGHLIINDTLKQQTTARKFTRHNLFDTNRHTQVKRCGCFFHKRKNWLHKNVLCWRKYKLIFAALYILQIKISERKLPLIRSKMFIPFDHKQYVWVDKRQLWSKVFRHNFFHRNQYLKYQAFSKAWDISNSERHLSASPRAESKLIISQSEFSIFLFVRMTLKWLIWRNIPSPTPSPLLIFERRPPPWYKFLSFPSLRQNYACSAG